MEENIYIIDSLGRWVDDSRVADRNLPISSNGSGGFCQDTVVNITTPTFILSADFGSCSLTERSSFRVAHSVRTRNSDAGEGRRVTVNNLIVPSTPYNIVV